jgi:hypothetical protein
LLNPTAHLPVTSSRGPVMQDDLIQKAMITRRGVLALFALKIPRPSDLRACATVA